MRAGRCPKCGLGKIETWGAEVADIADPEFKAPIAEIAAFYTCSRDCGWLMGVPKDRQWRTPS